MKRLILIASAALMLMCCAIGCGGLPCSVLR